LAARLLIFEAVQAAALVLAKATPSHILHGPYNLASAFLGTGRTIQALCGAILTTHTAL